MLTYGFLVDIAIILLATKLLGLLTKRFSMPQVVGALLAGLILGPGVLGVLKETDFLKQISELGVIVLMFTAGLETSISDLKKTGKASFIIALMGVLVPLAGGFAVSFLFGVRQGQQAMLQNVFIGIILTATSVSITVETLKEMGKLSTKAGNAILGAAIIDDILGIVALTVIMSMADSGVNIVVVLLKILGFFLFSGVAGYIIYILFNKWVSKADRDLRRFVIMAFVICLLLSYAAEKFFGVADITGAFIAGLIISSTQRTHYIASRFETLSYMLLSPIFFASIGITVVLPQMSVSIIMFTVLLTAVAILTKIIGCGLGGKVTKFTNRESLQIGVGMISRGEVALIVANKGLPLGLINAVYFGPIIIMVVVTTIITPILLKLVFRSKNAEVTEEAPVEDAVVKSYEGSLLYELYQQAADNDPALEQNLADLAQFGKEHQQHKG
ncbi:MAG: cation:proton antiporter [Clostridia bacterium]|nr:cation:proton antiporter [Clostridia bacterium]